MFYICKPNVLLPTWYNTQANKIAKYTYICRFVGFSFFLSIQIRISFEEEKERNQYVFNIHTIFYLYSM